MSLRLRGQCRFSGNCIRIFLACLDKTVKLETQDHNEIASKLMNKLSVIDLYNCIQLLYILRD